MSHLNLIVAGVLFILVLLLLRVNNDIGRNPHQHIKKHEDLIGSFPPGMSNSEKLRLINLRGISSSSTKRIVALIVVIALYFVFELWRTQ